jgi:diguanylate cyclase (GGDEF)-like protein
MDVHSLQLTSPLGGPRATRRRRRPRAAARPDPRGPEAKAADSTRRLLLAYTGTSIVVGLAALAWTTATIPLLPALNPGLDATSLAGPSGGLLLWIAFGLVGSLRVLPIPGSSAVWTFHFPFVAAAMVLGGPTAGAWVGFLATLERRELESQPWYGTLANHAVIAFGAVVGGLTVLVVRGALASANIDPGAAGVLAIAAGTLVLAVTVNGVAAGTIILRERLAPMAVVFTVAYVAVGWWAPLALAVVVLLVWPGEGFEGIDPLMKLPRRTVFKRELESTVARTRRGLAPGGLLLVIDLDGFGQLNKDFGMHVGDEVLAEIGERLRALVRTTDVVARLGGDELAMLYRGAIDAAAAVRLAAEVEAAIRRPVATSVGAVRVGVSIGALPIRPAASIPSAATLMDWADGTMQEQKKAQKEGRSQKGVKFDRYGASPSASDERSDGHPTSWRSRLPRGRSDVLELGAFVAASAVLVAPEVVLGIRLLR